MPYTLSALHAVVSWAGASVLTQQNHPQSRRQPADGLYLFIFSVLYTINIGIGNLSMYSPLPIFFYHR